MIRTDARSDAQLLSSFLQRRDEEAFEALVARHEALVLRVCARVLQDEHGARDAAQAVFLVLARKGAALDLTRPLGPWLHHVAYGVAVSAFREREARRERGRKAMNGSPDRGAAGGAVPPTVATLTKGAMNMMLFAKFKAAAVALLAAGAFIGAATRGPASAEIASTMPASLARPVEIPTIAETPITFEPGEREE